tara:strand:+ start:275 stop:964 length:690 start_codon:yes stop_codon:yes gene_type:complete
MVCPICKKKFVKSHPNRKFCSNKCSKKSDAINKKKYLKSDKYKKVRKKYAKTEKYRKAKKRYNESEKGKKKNKEYKQSDRGIKSREKYYKSSKYKITKNKYRKSSKGKETLRTYYRKRRKTDPVFKLIGNIRNRLNQYLKASNITKTNSTFKIVGCTPEYLKKYLEKQFYANPKTNEPMTWENYSLKGWHVDHIKPLDNAETSEDLEELCYYTNLQPLWADENIKKSNK